MRRSERATEVLRPRFIAIARIVRPQGNRGEVSAEITTDFPGRFQRLERVFLGAGWTGAGRDQTCQEFTLERAWPHKGRIVLKLVGIDSISQANALRGREVLVPYEERVPLPKDTYYWLELERCRVVAGAAAKRVEIGTVVAVEPTNGVPLLHVARVKPGGGEVLIPLAQEICREIDPEAKLIVIDPPEDLLELNETHSEE